MSRKAYFLTIACAVCAACGCASNITPSHPVSCSIENESKPIVLSFFSSALTGSIHLKINGEIIASGSFGMFFGENAEGKGTYKGHEVFFSAKKRKHPTCSVFIDGKEIAKLCEIGESAVILK